jgi:hypothetical protein
MVRWASCPPCGRLSERWWPMRGLEAHATKNPSQPRTYLASRQRVVPAAGSPRRAWRMPGAAEEAPLCVEPASDRRAPGTAPVGPKRNASPLHPFSCPAGPENLVPLGVRAVTQRWDVPLLENVLLTPRTCVGTFSRVAILGRRVTENRETGTKKAVETLGGGRHRPRTTIAPRHRRAASRSGGAAGADRDGRPEYRRTTPPALRPSKVLVRHQRHVRTPCPDTVTVSMSRAASVP